MTAKLKRLAEQLDAAQAALHREFEREFPVGARIGWYHRGKHRQVGVVDHNHLFGDMRAKLRARNERTGRLVWVSLEMDPHRTGED